MDGYVIHSDADYLCCSFYYTGPAILLQSVIKWVLRHSASLKILFMKESTEGVAEGQTTAEAGKPEIEENVGQESVRKTV